MTADVPPSQDKPLPSSAESVPTHLDEIFKVIGQFGPYQRRIVLIVSLVSFSTAFNNLGYVFWAARSNYHCISNEDISPNITDEEFLNRTIPWEVDSHGHQRRSTCSIYQFLNESRVHSDNHSIWDCQRWRYDTSGFKSTIVTEWNLVCSRQWLSSATQSVYMAGRIVGSVLYGYISDKFGRRITLLVSVGLQLVFSFSSAWIGDIYLFLVVRFLLGIQTTGEFQTAFVIASEFVGPSFRTLTGVIIHLYWATGYMTITGLAYLCRDRFTLQLVLSVPLCCLVMLYWLIPETPRYLLASGKCKKCMKMLDVIAVANGTKLPENISLEIDEVPKTYNLIDLFRHSNIRRTAIILLFLWFINSFVYYGLSLSSTSLGGNMYINFFISGLVEIPAHIFCLITFTKFGRPKPFCFAILLAGLTLTAAIFIPKDLMLLSTSLVMLGKASITSSYAMIYIYSAELYPTPMRSIGVGAGTLAARIGGVLAPFAADLAFTWKYLHLVLFCGLALVASMLVIFLPETKDKPMPQTVEEGENLNAFKMPCGRNKEDTKHDHELDAYSTEGRTELVNRNVTPTDGVPLSSRCSWMNKSIVPVNPC